MRIGIGNDHTAVQMKLDIKEYLESTSDLPISIFRNFKQYMLDTICKEKEKIKEEITVLSNDMQNLITDTSISLDL